MTLEEKLADLKKHIFNPRFDEFPTASERALGVCLSILEKCLEQRDGLSHDISFENRELRIAYMNAALLAACGEELG